jgi:hypothetical protein
MPALRGGERCYNHSPRSAHLRRASRAKGGQRRRIPNASLPAPVATIAELQAHLGRAIADALMHNNTLNRSGVVARLVLAAVKLLEVGELERRLADVERRLEEEERP